MGKKVRSASSTGWLKVCLLVMLALFMSFAACETAPVETPTTSAPSITSSIPPLPTYQDEGDGPPLLLNWWIDNLAYKPDPPVAGQPVEIWADISIGDLFNGYVGVHLLLNGEVVAYQQFLMQPDEITPFHFIHTFNQAGNYTVSMRAAMEVDPASLFGLTRTGNFVTVYGEITVRP